MQENLDNFRLCDIFLPMSSYYSQKYSFEYPLVEDDGTLWHMCTIPIHSQIKMYVQRIGSEPRSYFDCGAATGVMVALAEMADMRASGIDVRRYTALQPSSTFTRHLFERGQIKIKSILDAAPVTADLAYCNGTLTYMNETTLPLALKKFQNVKLLIAIHNTNEDLVATAAMGDPIVHSEPRLIRSKSWWMDTFRKNGFNVDFDSKYQCFCARPTVGCSVGVTYGGGWAPRLVAHAR